MTQRVATPVGHGATPPRGHTGPPVARGPAGWPGELAGQFTNPLAVLLALAAVLAWASGTPRLTAAITVVILLHAGFAGCSFVAIAPGAAPQDRRGVAARPPAGLRRQL